MPLERAQEDLLDELAHHEASCDKCGAAFEGERRKVTSVRDMSDD